MQQHNGHLVFSPSDLAAFLACPHLPSLELAVTRGELERPAAADPQGELIRRKGDEHERTYLEHLCADGKGVVTVFRGERDDDWDLVRAARETEDAMRAGAEVIYQGVLLSPDGWRRLADFLERAETPSALGEWSYEVADTKLARHSKPAHILQLCFYSHEVTRVQGRAPERMHLLLGSGERESFRPGDFDAYFRRVRSRFLEFVAAEPPTYPLLVDHCPLCDFLPRCQQQWRSDDHLTLVARMRRDQIARLEDAGIRRLDALATTPPGTEIPRMAPASSRRSATRPSSSSRRAATGGSATTCSRPRRSGDSRRCRSPRPATFSSTSRAIPGGSLSAGSSTSSASSGVRAATRATAPSGRTTATASGARSRSWSTSSTSGCAPTPSTNVASIMSDARGLPRATGKVRPGLVSS